MSPSKSKNKKAKFNVKDLISSTNQCQSDMSSTIIDLASSTKKTTASSEEIAFKKGIWDDKKNYMDKKLEEKQSHRQNKSRLETNKMMLDILKQDRDDAIGKYKEEDDPELKSLFKSDYKNFAALYSKQLKRFVSESSEREVSQSSRVPITQSTTNTQETFSSSSSASGTFRKTGHFN